MVASKSTALLDERDEDRADDAPPISAAVLVAFGVLVELLQGPIPYRYFSYADVLANALGALLATGWFHVESRLENVRVPG